MNKVDREILNILQLDSRKSYSSIGEVVGLSVTAVKDRIDKLQAKGVFQNFSIKLNRERVGADVLAFVQVAIDRLEDCQTFETEMRNTDSVLECHHITGAFNYLLKLVAPSMAELEKILTDDIKIAGVVGRTETTIVFSSQKDSAFINCVKMGEGNE
ncbi:AsnC family transcriptional regulator [Sneathiella sp. P13V-1]|uniref:Lrp/AsnC family transcriptional regulator n=1 Tax=Sneathiella sp. P13V-1 TaxID=2697366 RepID=UPI00187B9768|nr:Lrp/AsnC family transcriptional regulator [Sneathiella sp. P13V-1]MBE7636708.1 AsnC family transcriptional regulator [Sneathiella sp. P13V-1]